jgi:hypothetical protein
MKIILMALLSKNLALIIGPIVLFPYQPEVQPPIPITAPAKDQAPPNVKPAPDMPKVQPVTIELSTTVPRVEFETEIPKVKPHEKTLPEQIEESSLIFISIVGLVFAFIVGLNFLFFCVRMCRERTNAGEFDDDPYAGVASFVEDKNVSGQSERIYQKCNSASSDTQTYKTASTAQGSRDVRKFNHQNLCTNDTRRLPGGSASSNIYRNDTRSCRPNEKPRDWREYDTNSGYEQSVATIDSYNSYVSYTTKRPPIYGQFSRSVTGSDSMHIHRENLNLVYQSPGISPVLDMNNNRRVRQREKGKDGLRGDIKYFTPSEIDMNEDRQDPMIIIV